MVHMSIKPAVAEKARDNFTSIAWRTQTVVCRTQTSTLKIIPELRYLSLIRPGAADRLSGKRQKITALVYNSLYACLHSRAWILWTMTCDFTFTLIFPFKLSNVILRHSSFPHTSTFSTFEVSYKNALYKFTVIIIIIIVIITNTLYIQYTEFHVMLNGKLSIYLGGLDG